MPWTIETVDSHGSEARGSQCRIALEHLYGRPAVIYVCDPGGGSERLKGAVYNGSSWDLGDIWTGDCEPANGLCYSLGDQLFHALWMDKATPPNIRHAQYSGGSWSAEVVEATAAGTPGTRGADIDSIGAQLRSVYAGPPDPIFNELTELIYNGGWQPGANRNIDAGVLIRTRIDASTGLTHACHDGASVWDIRHSWDDGAAWQDELAVEDEYGADGWNWCIDSASGLHLAWCKIVTGGLRYGHKADGGAWVLEDVPGTAGWIADHSHGVGIGVDTVGNVYVAVAVVADSIRFARKSGGVWTLEQVEAVVAGVCDLAVTAAGTAHIVYQDLTATPDRLRHAYRYYGANIPARFQASPLGYATSHMGPLGF